MDLLVILSKTPGMIGFPASHLGSATFTASVNACQYCRSYSSNVYPAANLSFSQFADTTFDISLICLLYRRYAPHFP